MEDFQDPFNPATQYEQGYLYYRFMTQQIEYKIKCKELEKLCNGDSREPRRTSIGFTYG